MFKRFIFFVLDNFLKTTFVLLLIVIIVLLILQFFGGIQWMNGFAGFICKSLDFKTIFSILMSFLLALLGRYVYDSLSTYKRGVDDTPYITFYCNSIQIFILSEEVKYLRYSVGGNKWKKLKTKNILFGGKKGELRLRGKNLAGTNGSIISFASNSPVLCMGDIRTLIDFENYKTTRTDKAEFKNLFYKCYQLNSAPELPSIELAPLCYSEMFYGCSSLVIPPELPARNLTEECYYGMFNGCSSLKYPPALSAINLANTCYSHMFFDCVSLQEVPELPALNLKHSCYSHMFQGCTSLTYPPDLQSLGLAPYCYSGMFQGCTSLKDTPKLKATVLAPFCYSSMFQGCISLKWCANMEASNLAEGCYSDMYSGCVSLESACDLPAKELSPLCYCGMFIGCKMLAEAPKLPALYLVKHCYSGMFMGCSSLAKVELQAVDINADGCLEDWLVGVSASGIFVKNKDAKWDNNESSGGSKGKVIPKNWIVENS